MRKLSKLLIVLVVVLAFTTLFATKTDAATVKDIVFDADYYLYINTDLVANGVNTADAAYSHFINYGIKEGRKSSPMFDVDYYLLYNADLREAFGYDYANRANNAGSYQAAYDHFVNVGIRENRYTSKYFDVMWYNANNPDLNVALGKDYERGFYHYITTGIYEGRDTSAIVDMSCYIGSNPDVANAFGYNGDNTSREAYRNIARHLFFYADQDGRNYSHVHTQLITPVKCGTTGVEVYGCFCKDPEANVEKVVSSPRQHQYVAVAAVEGDCAHPGSAAGFRCSICGTLFNSNKVEVDSLETSKDANKHNYSASWVWNEENFRLDSNKSNIEEIPAGQRDDDAEPTVQITLTCDNGCGSTITRTVTNLKEVADSAVKANCVKEVNASVDYTATIVIDKVTYTDTHTVTLPYEHKIEWSYRTVTDGVPKTTDDPADTTQHRGICSKCDEIVVPWTNHYISEFVLDEENGNSFTGKCECGLNYDSSLTSLAQALRTAQANGVSVVRLAKTYNPASSSGSVTVPANVTLVVETPFKVPEGQSLVITVEKGGHIDGELGENVLVDYAGSKEVEANVDNADALSAALELAEGKVEGLGNGERVAVNVKIDKLDDSDDENVVNLNTDTLTVSEKVDLVLDLQGNKMTNASAENGRFLVVGENGSAVIQNGSLDVDGADGYAAIRNEGSLTLSDVEIESDYDAILMASKGILSITGGSINSTSGRCISTNHEDTPDNGKITLNNVDMTAGTEATVIYLPAKTDVSINNCVLSGKEGIEIARGTLNVTNSTIKYTTDLPDVDTGVGYTAGQSCDVGGALLIRLTDYLTDNDDAREKYETVNVSVDQATKMVKVNGKNVVETSVPRIGIFMEDGYTRENNLVANGFNVHLDTEVRVYGDDQN